MIMGTAGKSNKRVGYITVSCTCHRDGGSTVPNKPLWVLEPVYSTPENTTLTYVLGDISLSESHGAQDRKVFCSRVKLFFKQS